MLKKKNLILLCFVLLLISVIIFPYNKGQNIEITTLKVAGITRSPLYLPLFVGMEKNYFNDTNLEFVNATGGDVVNTMLLSGEIDIALNSLNMVLTNSSSDSGAISIGELTNRGGMTLISKVPIKDIQTVVSAKAGGLPNIILEKNTDYDIVANLSPQEGVTYFLNQKVDAIIAFEPFATKLKKEGYQFESMNKIYNQLPFSCILVLKNNLNKNIETYQEFLNGIIKSIEYIYITDSRIIATEVAKIMEYEDLDILTEIIETFKKDEVWNRTTIMDEQEYDYYLKLSEMKPVSYENVYTNILNK